MGFTKAADYADPFRKPKRRRRLGTSGTHADYARRVLARLVAKGMPPSAAEHAIVACDTDIRAAKRAGKSASWTATKCFATAAFGR